MLNISGAPSSIMSFCGWRLLRMFRALYVVIVVVMVLASFICCDGYSPSKSHPRPPDAMKHALESHLLQLLGMKRRPHTNLDSPTVPTFMLELFQRQRSETTVHFALKNLHTSTANTVRSYTHTDGAKDDRFPPNTFWFHFNISNLPKTEEITAAELRLFHTGNLSVKAVNTQRIMVHDVVRPSVKGGETHMRLVDTRISHPHRSKWIKMDVLPAVQRWHQNSRQNHGLLVKVMTADGSAEASEERIHLHRLPHMDEKTWQQYQPVLVVFTDDGRMPYEEIAKRTRSRRSPNERRGRRRGGRENCSRHQLYVDFRDVGWEDWIVAPPGYHAFYCQGDCPFPLADHLNATNHAIVQNLVNSMQPKAVPKACCVPTELSPISMLYVDEYDKVVLKNYQDMVVVGCGCR